MVSFETSFDSKQPKLEPKLASALSETKRLFRSFRFYTETESFDVSIEPKQTEDQQKQFDKEHILPFLQYACTFMFQNCLVNTTKYSKLCMYKYGELTFSYSFFSVWTHKLRFLAKLLHIPKRAKSLGFFRFYRISFFSFFSFFSVCFETEDPPKQFKRDYIWVFFRKFRVVSVCSGLLRNRSVCFGCFDIGSKHRNKPKFFVFGFTKQTETNAKQILFRFVSVRTKIYFCLFRGHPRRT
jgi:hypothetical protein